MAQLTGKADVYVDGVYAETTQEGSTLDGIAGVENTPVMNSRGETAGYTSKAVPGVITANFTHGPDFDITLYTGDGLSMEFVCDNGVVYLMPDATFQKTGQLDANKGTIPISFFGDVVPMNGGLSL